MNDGLIELIGVTGIIWPVRLVARCEWTRQINTRRRATGQQLAEGPAQARDRQAGAERCSRCRRETGNHTDDKNCVEAAGRCGEEWRRVRKQSQRSYSRQEFAERRARRTAEN